MITADEAGSRTVTAIIRRTLVDASIAQEDLAPVYSEAVEAAHSRALKNPNDSERRRDIAVILANLGDVFLLEEKWPEAVDAYRQGLEVVHKLAEDDPSSAQRRHDESTLLLRLGDGLLKTGR